MPIFNKISKSFLSSFLILLSSGLMAGILTVNQNDTAAYQHIQTAIDEADSGDTVLVYPGVYYKNLQITKSLFLTSLNYMHTDTSYIHSTVIDGNQSGSCIAVETFVDVTIRGFTIQNGLNDSHSGGGIRIFEAGVVVKNCIIQNNACEHDGGGIYCGSGSLSLSGTCIRYNSAKYGGGLQARSSGFYMDPVNKNNVYLNHSHHEGTDISLWDLTNGYKVVVDTFTVLNPDKYFIRKMDTINNINISVEHGFIEQVSHDLYVSPDGSNSNSGLSPDEPLKNFWYANAKILVDSVPLHIYLDEGIYSNSANEEKFPIPLRNKVILKGKGENKTIIDGDSSSNIFNASRLEKINIQDLSLMNGFTGGFPVSYSIAKLSYCDEVFMKNVCIRNGMAFDHYPAVHIYKAKVLRLERVDFIDNQGSFALSLSLTETDTTPRGAELINCRFINNRPVYDVIGSGGAARIYSPTGDDFPRTHYIIGCEFTDNFAKTAPCIRAQGKSIFNIINCTFANNKSLQSEFSPLTLKDNTTAKVYNSIFHNYTNHEIEISNVSGVPYEVEIYHSLVKNATQGINVEDGIADFYYDTNTCINLPPEWGSTGNFPYYLQADSPCIGAGTQDLPGGVELPEFDIAGGLRIAGDEIEMGAFEYIGPLEVPELPNQQIDEKLLLWPNPASDHVNIKCKIENPGAVRLRIYDAMGKLCIERNLGNREAGAFEHFLQLGLKPGIYFVRFFQGAGVIATKKLMVR